MSHSSITMPSASVMQPSMPTAAAGGAAARRRVAGAAASLGAMFTRCGVWLRGLNDAARLREIEPHMARDIGVAPGCDRCPEGYAVDPRPLWGIGLTPRPMDVAPPWSGTRRDG